MHGDMSDLVRGLPGKLHLSDVAVATLFTTQSATSLLEKVRRQIKASTPAAAELRDRQRRRADGVPAGQT